MADQLDWQRAKRLRPPDSGDLLSSIAASTGTSEHARVGTPVQSVGPGEGVLFQDPLGFVQSPLGVVVYQWWAQGLVPSITVAADLGLAVLQAFRNQRELLQ